jgi:hypothetical protein
MKEKACINKGADKMLQPRCYKLLPLACLAMWCGLLVVGLWPFRFLPDNRVQWLANRNGVHFIEPSQIYSAIRESKGSAVAGDSSFSIEIWLQPEKVGNRRRTIFSTYDSGRRESFGIGQSVADLLVRGPFLDMHDGVHPRSIYVDGCFREGEERFRNHHIRAARDGNLSGGCSGKIRSVSIRF